MDILEFFCDSLGIEVNREWSCSDGFIYKITEDGIIKKYTTEVSKWEKVMDGGLYRGLMTGEVYPLTHPCRGRNLTKEICKALEVEIGQSWKAWDTGLVQYTDGDIKDDTGDIYRIDKVRGLQYRHTSFGRNRWADKDVYGYWSLLTGKLDITFRLSERSKSTDPTIIEALCNRLRVDIGEEWEGIDGDVYKITNDEDVIFMDVSKTSKTGESWMPLNKKRFQALLTGDIRPKNIQKEMAMNAVCECLGVKPGDVWKGEHIVGGSGLYRLDRDYGLQKKNYIHDGWDERILAKDYRALFGETLIVSFICNI